MSSIISKQQNDKIIGYFPIEKRNFFVINIYKGSRDGWESDAFTQLVHNQGPALFLCKTKKHAICGGFTSKSWDSSRTWVED